MKFIKPHFPSCLKFVQKCTENSLLNWLGFSKRSGTLFGNLKSVVLSYWHTGRLSDMTLSDMPLYSVLQFFWSIKQSAEFNWK